MDSYTPQSDPIDLSFSFRQSTPPDVKMAYASNKQRLRSNPSIYVKLVEQQKLSLLDKLQHHQTFQEQVHITSDGQHGMVKEPSIKRLPRQENFGLNSIRSTNFMSSSNCLKENNIYGLQTLNRKSPSLYEKGTTFCQVATSPSDPSHIPKRAKIKVSVQNNKMPLDFFEAQKSSSQQKPIRRVKKMLIEQLQANINNEKSRQSIFLQNIPYIEEKNNIDTIIIEQGFHRQQLLCEKEYPQMQTQYSRADSLLKVVDKQELENQLIFKENDRKKQIIDKQRKVGHKSVYELQKSGPLDFLRNSGSMQSLLSQQLWPPSGKMNQVAAPKISDHLEQSLFCFNEEFGSDPTKQNVSNILIDERNKQHIQRWQNSVFNGSILKSKPIIPQSEQINSSSLQRKKVSIGNIERVLNLPKEQPLYGISSSCHEQAPKEEESEKESRIDTEKQEVYQRRNNLDYLNQNSQRGFVYQKQTKDILNQLFPNSKSKNGSEISILSRNRQSLPRIATSASADTNFSHSRLNTKFMVFYEDDKPEFTNNSQKQLIENKNASYYPRVHRKIIFPKTLNAVINSNIYKEEERAICSAN